MKIKIIKRTVAGLRMVYPGEVIDASDNDAKILIGSGKAFKYEGEPEPVVMTTEAAPEVIEKPRRGRPPKVSND